MRYISILLFIILLVGCKNANSDKVQEAVLSAVDTGLNAASEIADSTLIGDNSALIPDNSVFCIAENQPIRFNPPYTFEHFKAKIFTGKLALPDFTAIEFADDEEYVEFISNGCKENGINFGGQYTIIHGGCGAMCEHIFIVNRATGKIYTEITPNEGRYGFLYKKDSYLLIANSNVFIDDKLDFYYDVFGTPELYVWKNDNFRLLEPISKE